MEGDVRQVRKKRTVNSLWILVILALAVGVFLYSGEALRYFDPQAADLGIEILQPAIVTIVYICIALVFSTLMAAFLEGQLRETAFGTWSRFGICFLAVFTGFCWLASGLL